jgi:hypothetical protein
VDFEPRKKHLFKATSLWKTMTNQFLAILEQQMNTIFKLFFHTLRFNATWPLANRNQSHIKLEAGFIEITSLSFSFAN